ncbi:flagellar biosynthetic protein FliR [Roseibaca sp. Y0-43]|uniref:flagellar biosynthetic protein FliR n=1 Tax=Roseibaca sp. Y0-43 TaxID=2816854 RepID=UPI001D0C4E08|nr:flagellar biosynthetic protein FliR [Roseibaca sp. Y0-43]MCC1481560.1 flagellar biosynthetic protein FliR [Roseibaca sp. Y0-43]
MSSDLVALLTALGDSYGPTLQAALIVFLRVGAMMVLLPAFGEAVIPIRVRLGLGLAFTAIITPALAPSLPPFPPTPLDLLRLVATETVAGFALGAGLRLFVIVLQVAGTIAAQATSLSQFFGGAGVDPQPAMSQILVMGGLALAVTLGLHVRLTELLLLSYQLFAPGYFLNPADLGDWGVAQVSRAFALAFTLAMPFVILSLVFYVALGAINKAMPQLMVAFVGAPAITFAGLALLLLTAPLILPIWHEAFTGFIANPVGGAP